MTRRDLLNQLNLAIEIFQKQTACENAIKKKENKYKYEGKTKNIGCLGRLMMAKMIFLTIVTGIGWFFLKFITEQSEKGKMIYNKDMQKLAEELGEMAVTADFFKRAFIVLTVFTALLRMGIALYHFFHNKTILRRNIEIRKYNATVNSEVQKKKMELEQIIELRKRRVDTWYPSGYMSLSAAKYFYFVIENGKADSLKEAMYLYDETAHQQRMEEMQKEMLAEERKQTLLKNVETTALTSMAASIAKKAENDKVGSSTSNKNRR